MYPLISSRDNYSSFKGEEAEAYRGRWPDPAHIAGGKAGRQPRPSSGKSLMLLPVPESSTSGLRDFSIADFICVHEKSVLSLHNEILSQY